MQAKKIIAADMRRALIKVRNELGPDAIILANRSVPNGVELLATNDSQAHVAQVLQYRQQATSTPAQLVQTHHSAAHQSANHQSANHQPAKQRSAEQQLPFSDVVKQENNANKKNTTQSTVERSLDQIERLAVPSVATSKPKVANIEEMKQLQREIDLLKTLLHSQSTCLNWGQLNYTQPIRAYLFQQFCRMGLSVTLIKSVIGQDTYQKLTDTQAAWQQAIHALANKIPQMQHELIDTEGVVALVGPTGSGKTTTIAKMAASHVKKYGNQQLGLISTDVFRLGAQHQLDTLGKLLGVPVLMARSGSSLQKALAQLSSKKLILIDTAGLTRRDPAWQIQLSTLQQANTQIMSLLTIASTSQLGVLQQSVEDYASLHLKGSLLTKIDESRSLGPAISVVIEQQLPLAYVTCGLAIPDDMVRLPSMNLLKQAVRLARESQAVEEVEAMCWWEQTFVNSSNVAQPEFSVEFGNA